ncbi:MAG: Ig-like domain-containing protein [Lachnospiraceae bacterium]|nr:Ig-like domain-containing protein [Lachnospiraceae bacterium]
MSMKNIKRKILGVMALTMAVTLKVPTTAVTNSVGAASIQLSKKNATIEVGQTITLKVEGTKNKVKWSSSKSSVAKVTQKGKVTGKKAGSAKITAKVKGKKLICKVTVKKKVTTKNLIKQICKKNANEMNQVIQSVNKYEQDHTLDIETKDKESCYATSYKMNLQLDREKKKISGTMQIQVKNNTADDLSDVCIRNYAQSVLEEQGRGDAKILNYAINGKKEGISLNVKNEDHSVVYLKSNETILPAKGSCVVNLEFDTNIPKVKDRFGYAEYDKKEFYQLSLFYPFIAVYEDGKWNESPYRGASSETNYTKCSEYDVTIQLPEKYEVIATGNETRTGQSVQISEKNMREFAMIIGNGYNVKSHTVKGVRVNSYGLNYKKNENHNKLALQCVVDSIELYTDLFGAYPYEELDVVQIFMPTGMEYPGMVMVGFPDVNSKDIKNLDQVAERYGCSSTLCRTLTHEVAHQWFYGTVGNDPYKEPWLDEGFAEYCEGMLYPQSGKPSIVAFTINDNYSGDYLGTEWGTQSNKEFDDETKMWIGMSSREKAINLPLDSYDIKDDEYLECVYEGGSYFLYELRKAMGDNEFFHALRSYYKAYYLKEATTEDFLNVIQAVNHSEKVEQVIQKYIAS